MELIQKDLVHILYIEGEDDFSLLLQQMINAFNLVQDIKPIPLKNGKFLFIMGKDKE
jgi:hypothetical protein